MRELPGTDGARTAPGQIFWSPDSSSIGFIADGKLKRVSVTGGPPQTLTHALNSARGTWGPLGVILIAPGPGAPLRRVSEAGGVSMALTRPGAGKNQYTPQFLPDGRHALYYVTGSQPEINGVYVTSLDGGAQPVRLLPDATFVRFTRLVSAGTSGHLLFVREGSLMAQPFDLETLRVIGESFPLAEPVSQFSVAANGALAYLSADFGVRQRLVWLDRTGSEVGSAGPPGGYSGFRLSPDERSVVFSSLEPSDIWVLDIARGVPSKITFDPGTDNLPIWSHDGLRILWPSNRGGGFDLYVKPASGTGQDTLFLKMGTSNGWATDWSRDGRWVLYQKPGDKTGQDLWIAPQSPGASGEPKPLLQSQFNEQDGVFSPDGRWIAYVSNESGRDEVYVQAFPLTDAKHRISTAGGTNPEWRKDGTELFYLATDQNLMAVPVLANAKAFEPGLPKVLFPIPGLPLVRGAYRRPYAPAADGRFLIAKSLDDTAASPITVVLNWRPRTE